MSDLVRRIRDGIMDGWSADYPCLDGELANEAADALEARDKTIAELVAALERIAFEGRQDRERVIASALGYINAGGKHPNDRTIAAVAISQAKSKDKTE